jgi:hypothetical protein
MGWKRIIPVCLMLMSALVLNAAQASAQQPARVTPQPARTTDISKSGIRQPVELTEEEMREVKGEIAPAVVAAAAAAKMAVSVYVRLFLAYSAKAEAEQIFHNGGHRLHPQRHTQGWLHWHYPLPYVHYHHQR